MGSVTCPRKGQSQRAPARRLSGQGPCGDEIFSTRTAKKDLAGEKLPEATTDMDVDGLESSQPEMAPSSVEGSAEFDYELQLDLAEVTAQHEQRMADLFSSLDAERVVVNKLEETLEKVKERQKRVILERDRLRARPLPPTVVPQYEGQLVFHTDGMQCAFPGQAFPAENGSNRESRVNFSNWTSQSLIFGNNFVPINAIREQGHRTAFALVRAVGPADDYRRLHDFLEGQQLAVKLEHGIVDDTMYLAAVSGQLWAVVLDSPLV